MATAVRKVGRRGCGCLTAWRLSRSHAAAAAAATVMLGPMFAVRQKLSSASPHTAVTSTRFLTLPSHSRVMANLHLRRRRDLMCIQGRLRSSQRLIFFPFSSSLFFIFRFPFPRVLS